ncbi:MAG: hypothetical protein WCF65_09825 [Parachlamydiaceae bacterium]
MKKIFFLIVGCVSTFAQISADYYGSYEGCANCFGFESVLTFDVGGGYRSDNLKWKRIVSPTEEVTEQWKNIGMGLVETNARFLACEHYLFKADFDCAWFDQSGHQTYDASTGSVLTEKLSSRTKGQAYNLSGALGYQFNFFCSRLSLAPLVGYSYNYQRFKNNQYNNELDTPETETSNHNRYKYRWNGPWVGAGISVTPYCDISFFFDYAFHWTKLQGNIGEHFSDIFTPAHVNASNGFGNEYIAGIEYVFCDGWFLGAKLDYKQFWGNKAHYHADGDEENTPVHDLSWNSYNITLDIGYNF